MENTNTNKTEFYGISYCLNGEYFLLMEKIAQEDSTNPFAFIAISSPDQIAEYIIQRFSKEKANLAEQLMAFNSLNPFAVKFNINSKDELRKEIIKYHDGSGQVLGIRNEGTNHELHGLRVKPSINEIKQFSINIQVKTPFDNVQIKNAIDDDNIQKKKSWFNPFNPNQQNLA